MYDLVGLCSLGLWDSYLHHFRVATQVDLFFQIPLAKDLLAGPDLALTHCANTVMMRQQQVGPSVYGIPYMARRCTAAQRNAAIDAKSFYR